MAGSSRASWFTRFANGASRATGKPGTFVLALIVVIVWAVTGPIFRFSDTWQLIINTGTTIVTFLMVFLIQNTQNRDSEAMHVKMDELIRALEGAHNALLDLEELDDKTLDSIRDRYRKLAAKARKDIEAGRLDIGCEEVEEAEELASVEARARKKKPEG
ncbi:MAG TPA: low affinity iron permease family protein [Rhodanobacteraceae bacterium]|jgi:low affinity Fe/Cu permease|nr:low affinity iron permease family protein [Rhodanobacteraceae bacterium]